MKTVSHPNSVRKAHCAFEGCRKTTEQPFADGWVDLAGWGPGVPDGRYCPEHAAAIERRAGFVLEPASQKIAAQ
jgi:hypothetical protein